MAERGVKIVYNDIAPNAKGNFYASASEQMAFSDLSDFRRDDVEYKNFINPCELNLMVLDGEGEAFPIDTEDENFGLWSEQLSNGDGAFEIPITVEFTANQQYVSQGFTLTFDDDNGIYPTHLSIEWYRDYEQLSQADFYPNSPVYFCKNQVSNYNRVVMTFYSLNVPQNRMRFRAIEYGYIATFKSDELMGVRIIQEVDPISTELSINTADFTLNSNRDVNFIFQAKQPVNFYFNGELKAATFVSSSSRTSQKVWNVQTEDFIGVLEGVPFVGGMYKGYNAGNLLEDIFNTAKVPHQFDDVFYSEEITGYLPYSNCREALMQVAFALGAVVSTANSTKVNVFRLEDDEKQTISLDRVLQPQKFKKGETVTAVELVSHIYEPISETADLYNANSGGYGYNIVVSFSEPMHDLMITNGDILVEHPNYAVINAYSGCVLTGYKYSHNTVIKTRKNPVVLASDLDKVLTIESATLVNPNNVDRLLDLCYNNLVKTEELNCKIVEGRNNGEMSVSVGDAIGVDTEYRGTLKGRVTRQTYNLNGGIIVKDTTLKQRGEW